MRLKKKKKQNFCLDFGATRVRTVDAGEEKGERGIESTACCLFFFFCCSAFESEARPTPLSLSVFVALRSPQCISSTSKSRVLSQCRRKVHLSPFPHQLVPFQLYLLFHSYK